MFVANTALSELNALCGKSWFFRDMGPNNKYGLIVNNASDEDLPVIVDYLRADG